MCCSTQCVAFRCQRVRCASEGEGGESKGGEPVATLEAEVALGVGLGTVKKSTDIASAETHKRKRTGIFFCKI